MPDHAIFPLCQVVQVDEDIAFIIEIHYTSVYSDINMKCKIFQMNNLISTEAVNNFATFGSVVIFRLEPLDAKFIQEIV
jgi:hypothetical protein